MINVKSKLETEELHLALIMVCIVLQEGRKRKENILSLYILGLHSFLASASFSLIPLICLVLLSFISIILSQIFLQPFFLFSPLLSSWHNMQLKYLYYYYLLNKLNIMFPVLSS